MCVLYDRIAGDYGLHDSTPQKEYSLKPVLLELLGDLDGKRCLDIGCGSGFFSRALKDAGALEVVGVDVSERQIELARNLGSTRKQGIEYHVSDVKSLNLGKKRFDIVSALLVLHYAESKDELDRMIGNVSRYLKQGGVFAGIVNNFDFPFGGSEMIGALTRPLKPDTVKDGDRIRVEIYGKDQKLATSFCIYHWSRKVYEDAFKRHGLGKIEWRLPIPTEDGLREVPEKHWRNPTTMAFRAVK